MKRITMCPFCECSDFVEGVDRQIVFKRFYNQSVIHTVCLNCGSIVHSRVKNLSRLQKIFNKNKVENNTSFVFNK